jgi:deoxyribodipyrimidine photo-lyase
VVKLNRAKSEISGPVVYWMSRDQRVKDNWALLYAVSRAKELGTSVSVVFALAPKFLGATRRQYDFMLSGLKEVESDLAKKGIPFSLLVGEPVETLVKYFNENKIAEVVVDFSPLRIGREWRALVARQIPIAMSEVDAHNIVPAWVASDKQEFSARTIRPKIQKLLGEFLVPFPSLPKQGEALEPKTNWQEIGKKLECDEGVAPVLQIKSGEKAGAKVLNNFINQVLPQYEVLKNDPNKNGQSELSPYLHFGQISAQMVALEVAKTVRTKSRDAFLEELIIRRELSENFCLFNPHYDSVEGFPNWAKKTLSEHAEDKREYVYSLSDFESAKTHDNLWNSAQQQMVKTGKMHGYMRMYWAKKILEWTKNPEQAMAIAIYLNDKYELDGRDPNGYAGIAWSIGGVHDRPWFNRPVYGMIRYMNASGAKSKFDVGEYSRRVS